MKPYHLFSALTACALTLATTSTSFADHHQTDAALKGEIRQFYMNMSTGKFADALDFVKDGAVGFVAYGLRIDITGPEVKQVATAEMTADFDKGNRAVLRPKHIELHALGDNVALATFYVEVREFEEGESSRNSINRVSLVLEKTGDGWKIAHFHASELKTRES